MTATTFDTHKFIRTLTDSGVPEAQAEAFSSAFKESLGAADFATKRDIEDLRRDMNNSFIQLEQRLIIKQGAMTAFAIGIVAILVKLL